MEKLLENTISGAASDSSARDPPPRCHPGTRLAILERCLHFIANCNDNKKIRWVVGSAGVGKSAILQNVAESPKLPVTSQASVFFSINGRNDGSKAILTLSYQLATKSEIYRQVIEYEIARDPSLLQSSLSVHFKKFIVEPFIGNSRLNSAGRILIIIDGLDECHNLRSQQEILRLIFDLCNTYPSSPIVWLIASRPEQHITSFFSRATVTPTYEKEEVAVDSDEARADVERFLRDEMKEIKASWYSLDAQSEWPDEKDLWKLANASGGLFAYAHTAIKYIGDPNIGNPVSQLSDVLNVIDNHPMTGIPRDEHPMALLDALYARILSNVPPKIMIYTRKLLLALASVKSTRTRNLLVLCNWLGMTPDEAYAAINHLQSVLRFPKRGKSHEEKLEPYHKSLIDYISDFSRSGFSHDIQRDARQLMTKCAFRVLKEAPDGIDFGDTDYKLWHGTVTRGPGTGETISLSWPIVQEVGWNDDETRLSLYKLAMGVVLAGMRRGDTTFHNEFYIRLLTTRFEAYGDSFPFFALSDLPFDKSRRHEFMTHGLIKQMPLKAIDISAIPSLNAVKLQLRRPASLAATESTDPWNAACDHERKGEWGEGNDQDWLTTFWPNDCAFCFERLKHQLQNYKTRFPDHTLCVLFTSTGSCCIEFTFVHPEDGISEWTYWFWCHVSLEERKRYGSTV
ncbi:hypothetical protein Agabi119p4_8388 [Agaricus bisporus var. burnettii]|uniref:NACHT domain-containing protein n=1 Tax=Agaricus bisporus var. burnettii TaxID=192524 RepID=A0A8H7C5Y5_AGABI|nr:hypothetical protein Agabi119p4_8388 [Agaricus bisporus var. burnettii]